MRSSNHWKSIASFATLVIAVGVLLFVTAGCGGGGGGTGTGGAQNVVTGIVLDSRRQDEPVGGATVVIGGVTAVTTTTDQANATNLVGSFRMENVPLDTEQATVTAPGQQPQTLVFSPPIGPGTNPALELIINIGQVSGRVLGPDGQPARDAFVSDLATGQIVQTNTEGRFLIDLVPLGPNSITAVLGTASITKAVEVIDGVTDAGDLTLVDDPNPDPPGNPVTIVGKVSLADNASAGAGAGTSVVLFRNGAQLETTTANANGDFNFYVPANTYVIRFIRPSYVDQDVQVTVTNPNQAVTANVTLQPR